MKSFVKSFLGAFKSIFGAKKVAPHPETKTFHISSNEAVHDVPLKGARIIKFRRKNNRATTPGRYNQVIPMSDGTSRVIKHNR